MSWKSKVADNVNARFTVYTIAVPITLFYALVLTGCISNSPGIPNIYLVIIKGANGTSIVNGDLAVRVGYFGMCASASGQNLTCSATRGLSATQVTSSFLSTNNNITTTVFVLATALQSQIFLFFLAIAGSIFLAALFVLFIFDRDMKRSSHSPKAAERRRILGKVSKHLVWTSAAVAVAASLGTYQAVTALQLAFGVIKDVVLIKEGNLLLTLQWLIVGFSVVFALGVNVVCNQCGGFSDSLPGKGGNIFGEIVI